MAKWPQAGTRTSHSTAAGAPVAGGASINIGVAAAFGDGYVDLALELGVTTDRINTITDVAAAARTGVRNEGMHGSANTDVLAELTKLVAAGDLDVPIAASYPLTEVRTAYRHLMRRHTRGKIALVP